MLRVSLPSALENPFAFGHLLSSAYMYIKKPIEITVFLKDSDDIMSSELLQFIDNTFVPNGIVSVIGKSCNLPSLDKYPLFKDKSLVMPHNKIPIEQDSITGSAPQINTKMHDGEFALVCKDFACSPPITDIQTLKGILLGKSYKEKNK